MVKKKSKKSKRPQNKNSRVVSSWFGVVARSTETKRRDEGTLTAEAKTSSGNSTSFLLEKSGIGVALTGRAGQGLPTERRQVQPESGTQTLCR